MLIQCLIEREGDTQITKLEGRHYKFARNEQGAMVCDVHNQEHIRWMLRSSSYREYAPPESVSKEAPALTTTIGDLIKDKKQAKRKAA